MTRSGLRALLLLLPPVAGPPSMTATKLWCHAAAPASSSPSSFGSTHARDRLEGGHISRRIASLPADFFSPLHQLFLVEDDDDDGDVRGNLPQGAARFLQESSSANGTSTIANNGTDGTDGGTDGGDESSSSSNSSSSSPCTLCMGAEIFADKVPKYEPTSELPANITCGQLNELVARTSSLDGISTSSADCKTSAIVQSFYGQCCNGRYPRYQCESTIRKEILTNYDAPVAPIPNADLTPMIVYVDLMYQFAESIDVQGGTATIFVTVDLVWTDPRLAYTVDEEHCAPYVAVWAAMNREKTEIWVPDVDLYNQVDGLQSFSDTEALVYPDGTVYWNRNGGLKAFCQFTGLAQIPFDTLGCQLLVGPWTRIDPTQIQYRLPEDGKYNETGGINFGTFLPTYNEFLPVPELAKCGYTFENSLLYYNLYFRRAENYFVFNLVIPTAILTYVSFGTFLLDLRVGERLSYGMALALVVVAQQIVTGDLVPVSNERLWIDKFIGWSFYWVIVGLVESVFVGYLYFLRQDKATKTLMKEKEQRLSGRQPTTRRQSTNEDTTGAATPNIGEDDDDDDDDAVAFPDTDSEAPPLTLKQQLRLQQQSIQESQMGLDAANEGANSLRRVSMMMAYASAPKAVATSSWSSWSSCWYSWTHTVSLRRIDHFSFFLTLTTYTCFLIAMFVSVPEWGTNLTNPFHDENSTGVHPV